MSDMDAVITDRQEWVRQSEQLARENAVLRTQIQDAEAVLLAIGQKSEMAKLSGMGGVLADICDLVVGYALSSRRIGGDHFTEPAG